MLRTRVITALVLLVALLPALFLFPPLAWCGAVVAVLTVAAWEWARVSRLRDKVVWPYALLTGVVGGGLLMFAPAAARGAYGIAFAFWLVATPLMFFTARRPSGWLAALAGWCVLLPFAAALADLRELGPWLLISVMALVWVADIAAYFVGRAFGKHKLAPSISPGKTWEGAVGGVVAVALYALLNWYFGNPLLAEAWAGVLPAAALLAAVSILGDLFESAMKRSAGLKDSSHLLPGHGGVLDRIDSLTSTLPVAALLLIWSGKL
jgi:phosphatidate cytidylyltransferase